jgi:hypothetical protein
VAIGVAWVVAAFFGFWSLYGWWFFFTVGQAHGPGLEIGVLAGAIAILAALVGASLKRKELKRLRDVERQNR